MSDSDELAYKYAWDWFEYHAKQRLTTFNFFIIIMGAIGYVYIFGNQCAIRDLKYWLALSGEIISFLFLLLEIRNTILVDDGRKAIDKLEKEVPLNRVFIRRADLHRFYINKKDKKNPGNSLLFRARHALCLHTLCLRFILCASMLVCFFIIMNDKNLFDWYYWLLLFIIPISIWLISIWAKIISTIFTPKEIENS